MSLPWSVNNCYRVPVTAQKQSLEDETFTFAIEHRRVNKFLQRLVIGVHSQMVPVQRLRKFRDCPNKATNWQIARLALLVVRRKRWSYTQPAVEVNVVGG
jgi:hypothetical protein